MIVPFIYLMLLSAVKLEETQEKGIDVSRYQGKIDWEKVAKDGIKHVVIKMSEGRSYVDPNFVTNWKGAQSAGIKVNAYHYFRGSNCTPQEQLDNIKKNAKAVGFKPSSNILAIDVEDAGNEKVTPERMADNLHELLKLIQRDLDCVPMIYTGAYYWNNKVKWQKYDFSVYPLWIAHWKVSKPTLPLTWSNAKKSWSWWQYSAEGKVPGITENVVDLDWVMKK